jgi:hypothetical protein
MAKDFVVRVKIKKKNLKKIFHQTTARQPRPRPQHPPRAVRRRRRPHHARPGHPRAPLHHHPRGVQAQPAATLRDLQPVRPRDQGERGNYFNVVQNSFFFGAEILLKWHYSYSFLVSIILC